MFKVGSRFRLTEDAIDNYGERYRGKTFIVRQWFDHYAPITSKDEHGHPGFDSLGSRLYEAEGLSMALYDWEIREV